MVIHRTCHQFHLDEKKAESTVCSIFILIIPHFSYFIELGVWMCVDVVAMYVKTGL